MDSPTFIAIATIVGVIAGLIAINDKGKEWVRKLILWVTRYSPTVPRETVRMVSEKASCKWKKHENFIILNGSLYVTNITDKPIHLLNSDIIKLQSTHFRDIFLRMIRLFRRRPNYAPNELDVTYPLDRYEEPVHGIGPNTPIPPGVTAYVKYEFFASPVFYKEGRDLKATIVLTDHLGNEYKRKSIFEYTEWH